MTPLMFAISIAVQFGLFVLEQPFGVLEGNSLLFAALCYRKDDRIYKI